MLDENPLWRTTAYWGEEWRIDRSIHWISEGSSELAAKVPGNRVAMDHCGNALPEAPFEYGSPGDEAEAESVIEHCEPAARQHD